MKIVLSVISLISLLAYTQTPTQDVFVQQIKNEDQLKFLYLNGISDSRDSTRKIICEIEQIHQRHSHLSGPKVSCK